MLPPQRGLAGELAPLLLSGGVRVEGEDQLAHLAHPVPAPAVDTEDRHDTGHACSEQRQRIKDALAHPQWSRTCLQRGGVEIPLHARKMIVPLRLGHLLCSADRTPIEVHQAPLRRGVGKDHAAAAPVTGRMRPGAWRRIAHAGLLRQRQGNAALLQVGFTTAAWQGSLEGGQLLGEVRPRGGRLARRRWVRR